MKKILLSLCFAAAALGAQAAAPCTPVGLRCEHLETPLGIDAPAPRLGWRLDDSRSGALQRAYRVVVGRDSAAVAAGCAPEDILIETSTAEAARVARPGPRRRDLVP